MENSKPEELTKARQAALRLLARRSRSVAEIESKLAERRFSPVAIHQTVEHLRDLGYLDDEAFARSRARYLMESRPMGRKRLAWELARTGLGKRLVEAVVEEAWEGRCELDVALALGKRRMESYVGLPSQKAKRRLKGYLERRGFGPSEIFYVLDELFPK